MAFYKYFWDLQDSTTFADHTVGSFDNNTNSGGGNFKWVANANNTSLVNIPGIRIKPTSSTNGYWMRISEGPVCVDWFGSQNTDTAPYTFQQLGVSQNTLNTRYGVGFVTLSDTYDTAAVKWAIHYMGTYAIENSVQFEPKKYWLTQSIDLPETNIPTGGLPAIGGQGKFIIDGNGCTISTYGSGAPFHVFKRIPVNQTVAATYINYSIVFKNFSATSWGSSWVNSGYAFLFLGASSNVVIDNINLVNYDVGLRLEYCPNATINNVFTSGVKTYSVYVKGGSWTGASLTNANSHNLVVNHLQVEDANSQTAALALDGVNNAVINQFWLKGSGTPTYGIKWDSLNNTEALSLKVMNSYITTDTATAAIYVKAQSGGMCSVDGVYNNTIQTLLATEMYSGSAAITLSNVPNWPAGTKLSSVGTVKWDFNSVFLGAGIDTPAEIVDPGNNLWVTAGPPAIPSVSDVAGTPVGGPQPVSLQEVLDYDHDLVDGNVFIGTLAGDNTTGLTNIIAIGTDANKSTTLNGSIAIGFEAGESSFGGTYIGNQAGKGSASTNAVTIGLVAGASSSGFGLTAIGDFSSQNNTGDNVTSLGISSANGNTGDDVVALGNYAAKDNTANDVIALGQNAGNLNALAQSVIISNNCLPSYANYAAAALVINALGGATTGTYLYHDQATNSIGAVRIP